MIQNFTSKWYDKSRQSVIVLSTRGCIKIRRYALVRLYLYLPLPPFFRHSNSLSLLISLKHFSHHLHRFHICFGKFFLFFLLTLDHLVSLSLPSYSSFHPHHLSIFLPIFRSFIYSNNPLFFIPSFLPSFLLPICHSSYFLSCS